MRVTGIRVVEVDVPIEPPFPAAWDPEPRTVHRQHLAMVETDEGLSGLGGGDLTGFDGYAHHFVGTDPTDLGEQARRVASCSFHGGRFWGLEAAFWDIAGQARGVPVAAMLGGAADRVRAYASAGTRRGPDDWAEVAAARRAEGFGALKMRLDVRDPEGAVASVRAVRDAAGPGLVLMVDLNEAWMMPGDTRRPVTAADVVPLLGPLAECDLTWLEEPLPLGDRRGYARLRSAEPRVRLAGGEMIESAALAWALLEDGLLDVHQHDAVLTTGLSELARLGRACREEQRWFSPHTWGDGPALLINLHLACGIGGTPWLEYPHDPPGWRAEVRDAVFAEPLVPDGDGWLHLPDRPGLGARLDHDRIADLTVSERLLT